MLPQWANENPITHRSFRLIDLLENENEPIEGRTIEDSTIYGPSVVVLLRDVTMEHCIYEGSPDALLWEILPDRESVIGAIGVVNCTFVRCRFRGIGFAGLKSDIDVMREAISPHE